MLSSAAASRRRCSYGRRTDVEEAAAPVTPPSSSSALSSPCSPRSPRSRSGGGAGRRESRGAGSSLLAPSGRRPSSVCVSAGSAGCRSTASPRPAARSPARCPSLGLGGSVLSIWIFFRRLELRLLKFCTWRYRWARSWSGRHHHHGAAAVALRPLQLSGTRSGRSRSARTWPRMVDRTRS